MELMFITILIICAILLSIILNHFFPFITLPLIQIIIGFVIGLTSIGHDISIPPELILILIIAPLLYNEAKKINTTKLWAYKKDVMVVAFPMVLFTIILLALFFKATLLLIPLTACFALASALAPTDLVTVSSLSNRMVIPEQNKIVLEGEGLINDASGITAFQLSALALSTGKFSVIYSIERLLIICIGGVIVGLLVHFIKDKVEKVVRRNGIEDTKFYLILDFLLPFLSYLVAEELHVSGILAVVTVGLSEAIKIKKSSLFDAKLNSLSDSTWEVVVTILNAVVFIYLGIQLPVIIEQVNDSFNGDVILLVLIIVGATLFLFFVRFCLFVVYKIYKDGIKENLRIKDQLILTLSGVKGTVTLATISSLPLVYANGQVFEERYLLIFIAAGVIVCSILIAIILLPLLLDKKEANEEKDYEIKIAHDVINLLTMEKNDHNAKEVDAVIKVYSDRIVHYYIQRNGLSFKQQKRLDREITKINLNVEYEELNRMFNTNEISEEAYNIYNNILQVFSRRSNKLFYVRFNIRNIFFRFIIPHPKKRAHRMVKNHGEYNNEYREEVKKIFVHNGNLVISKIRELECEQNRTYLKVKIKEEERLIDLIANDKHFGSLLVNINPNYTKEMEKGLQLERTVIQQYYENGLITLEQSLELKQNINVLEEYYMMDTDHNLSYYFLNQVFTRENDNLRKEKTSNIKVTEE